MKSGSMRAASSYAKSISPTVVVWKDGGITKNGSGPAASRVYIIRAIPLHVSRSAAPVTGTIATLPSTTDGCASVISVLPTSTGREPLQVFCSGYPLAHTASNSIMRHIKELVIAVIFPSFINHKPVMILSPARPRLQNMSGRRSCPSGQADSLVGRCLKVLSMFVLQTG